MSTILNEDTKELLHECALRSRTRAELWMEFIRRLRVQRMAEIGVYRGAFAAFILERCDSIEKYFMIDPWKHLADWNKPANESDSVFEDFYREAKQKTDFAQNRRSILRGKTAEVIDQIPDNELDFAYIDGDHTLRGITIDLLRVYSKVKPGGFVGGDDFTPTVWQHDTRFEPTLVYPLAVYFAEAMGAAIYALPNSQFCIQKTELRDFSFTDLTGQYRELGLRNQLRPQSALKFWFRETFPKLAAMAGKSKRLLSAVR
jgi:hypothetical protein